MVLELVVAHFNENLDWLKSYGQQSTIYSKGESPNTPSLYKSCLRLPNIGRESHTFLTHIVNNYESLPDMTLFLQGDIHTPNPPTPAHVSAPLDEIVQQAQKFSSGSQIYPIAKRFDFRSWNGLYWSPEYYAKRCKLLRHSEFTPGQFWEFTFGEKPPTSATWIAGAVFAVTRDAIRRRPMEFYQRLLDYFVNLNSNDPEEGHYMEVCWYYIFSDDALNESGEKLWPCLDPRIVIEDPSDSSEFSGSSAVSEVSD